MPAEWEPHIRCWMGWPTREAIWGEYLQAASEDYANIARSIAQFEPVVMLTPPGFTAMASEMCGPTVEIVPWDLEDSWLRDTGPNFLKKSSETAAAIFHFNAWGGKDDKWDDDATVAPRLCEHLDVPHFPSGLTLEGGGLHVDGEGTVLTTETVVLNDNRNPGITMAEAEEALAAAMLARTRISQPELACAQWSAFSKVVVRRLFSNSRSCASRRSRSISGSVRGARSIGLPGGGISAIRAPPSSRCRPGPRRV